MTQHFIYNEEIKSKDLYSISLILFRISFVKNYYQLNQPLTLGSFFFLTRELQLGGLIPSNILTDLTKAASIQLFVGMFGKNILKQTINIELVTT